MRGLRNTVATLAIVLFCAGTVNAGTYQIQFSGIDINYNQATGFFCDNGGGVGCFGAEDPLFTMNFILDGVLQGSLNSNIGFNFALALAPGTSPFVNATNAVLPLPGSIFDLEISSVPGLFTDITSGSVTFSNGSVNATGTGFSTIFGAQNLPFGFVATNPVNWSFSSGTGSCTGLLASCTYSGTGEVSWTTVPDAGSTLALLGLGLVSLGSLRRRFAGR